MSEPKRVLHIFAALDSGGVSNFVMNVYRRIDREKFQFDFALTGGKRALFDEEAEALGGRLFYFDNSKRFDENLEDILKSSSFDAVHSHVFFYSGEVLRIAGRYGVPVRIAHAHNAHTGEAGSLPRKAYEAGMRMLIRRNATILLGCSEKACRYVFGDDCMADRRCSVMPDGIDCSRFAFDEEARNKSRKEYGLEDKFVVGHVGHFNPAKNHGKLLEVFAELAVRRPDAALLLVGDGELEDEVRALAVKLGIADKTVFAGAHREVENLYQAMDVFVFPSRYEGFGMAMVEAQTNGLACLASDVVPEDTNAGGRAVYLPLAVSNSVWADAVLSLPERDCSSFDEINERFGIDAVAKANEKIYLGRKYGGLYSAK